MMTVATTVSTVAREKRGILVCIGARVVGSISMAELVMLLECGHEKKSQRLLRIGTAEFCLKCFEEKLVVRTLENWTIKCVHIEHSMTRTYGVNKEYAIERALAHTKRYGRAHICMVFQRSKFDETMYLAIPSLDEGQQEIIDVSDIFRSNDSVIKAALGIVKEAFPETEEIPF